MGALRLHAIAVDDVRDIVGADQAASQRLRELAREAYRRDHQPDGVPGPPGLLGRLGPIFRRAPQALVVDRDDPTPDDLETLLAGRYVQPERAVATWRLLQRLVVGLAWGSTEVDLDRARQEAIDFDLARAGLSSDVGLGRLLTHDAMIAMLPPPGELACARPHTFAVAMAEAWGRVLAEDPGPVRTSPHRGTITEVSHWLDGFAHWTRVATERALPLPDLVAFYRP